MLTKEAFLKHRDRLMTVAPSPGGGDAVLVVKIVNDHGEESPNGGPDAGGPEGPTRGATP